MTSAFGRDRRARVSIANLVIFLVALALVIGGFAWRFSSGSGIQGWLGTGEGDHEHQAGGFASPLLKTNESWSHTFTQEGVYAYSCHPHPSMQGWIRVTSTNASALSGTVQVHIRNLSFEPATLEVKPGTVVEWRNEDLVEHNAVQVATEEGLFGLAWWEASLVGVALLAGIVLIAAKFTARRSPPARADTTRPHAPETARPAKPEEHGADVEPVDDHEEST